MGRLSEARLEERELQSLDERLIVLSGFFSWRVRLELTPPALFIEDLEVSSRALDILSLLEADRGRLDSLSEDASLFGLRALEVSRRLCALGRFFP